MMGMRRIRRAAKFFVLTRYSLKDMRGEVIGGNMVSNDAKGLAKEFEEVKKLRGDVKRAAWHQALRLPKGDHLSSQEWVRLADDYMKRLGFSEMHQRVYILHSDADGEHIHIIANRVSCVSGAKIYYGQNENLKSSSHIRSLEKIYGLAVFVPDPNKIKRRAIGSGEKGMAERTGEPPNRLAVQAIIDTAVADKPSLAELVARLDDAGVTIRPSGKTGAAQGVSFELDGVAFKGSDLGKSYAWKQLQARIDYDLERDQHIIDKLRARALEEDQEDGGELVPAAPYSVATATYKGPQRTLELAMEKDGDTYKWKNRDRVALVDNGDSISVLSRADSAIRASLQLAKDKGWKSVKASGNSLEFRRKSWLIGSLMGLEMQGYEPTEADKEELSRQLKLKEVQRNERKSSRTQTESRSPGAAEDERVGIGRASAPDGHRPQLDSGRSQSGDRGSQGSKGEIGQQFGSAVELQTSSTDHSRGPAMADAAGIHVDRVGLGDIRNAAQSVSDIAAPIGIGGTDRQQRQDSTDEHQRRIQPDLAAKIAAWERQSAALGAEKYRITLKPRVEKDRNGRKLFDKNYGNDGRKREREAAGISEKFWTAGEVRDELFKLRAKNAQGFDIYITPVDDRKHFIVVDDMTPEKEKALLDAGIKPAIIQKSSNSNKQAIIIIDREPGKDEQKLANQLVLRLNKKFGDEKFSGVIHPFRMAGFSNKKGGKQNHLTTLDLSICRKCETVSVAMSKLRDADRLEEQEADRLKKQQSMKAETDKERSRRMSEIDNAQQIGSDAVVSAYRREVRKTVGLVKRNNWTLDWSRVDFSATKELIKNGYRHDLIMKAIIEASPGLAGRHMDAARYASDTVRNAAADPEVKRHLETQQAKRTTGAESRALSR